MCWGCFWDVFEMFWGCFWDVLGMIFRCFGDLFGMFWEHFWDVLGMIWVCGMILDYVLSDFGIPFYPPGPSNIIFQVKLQMARPHMASLSHRVWAATFA